jgi:hypothetical protein
VFVCLGQGPCMTGLSAYSCGGGYARRWGTSWEQARTHRTTPDVGHAASFSMFGGTRRGIDVRWRDRGMLLRARVASAAPDPTIPDLTDWRSYCYAFRVFDPILDSRFQLASAPYTPSPSAMLHASSSAASSSASWCNDAALSRSPC